MNGGSSLICHVIHVQEKIALVLLCFVGIRAGAKKINHKK